MNNPDIELLPLGPDDLEQVRVWRNSPEVSQYMYTSDHISAQQQLDWYQRISTDPSQQYWVIAFQGKKLGVASIYNINRRFQSCHWAFYLAEPMARGAHIGSKVEFRLLDYVFNTLGLNRLIAEVFAFNERVIAMHEKFGFRREGYYRQHVLKEGVHYDVVALALLNSEWQALREMNYNRIYYRAEVK